MAEVSDFVSHWSENGPGSLPQEVLGHMQNDSEPITKTFPSYGYSNKTHWFYICLSNNSQAEIKRFLQIDFSHLDIVNFYIAQTDKNLDSAVSAQGQSVSLFFEKFTSGRLQFNDPNDYHFNLNPIQKLGIRSDKYLQLLIEVRSKNNIMLPMTLHSGNNLMYFQDMRERTLFLYLGSVLSILAMSIGVLIISRQIICLYQSLLILFLHLIGSLCRRGYGLLWAPFNFFKAECLWGLGASLAGSGFFILLVREYVYEEEDQISKDKYLLKLAQICFLFIPMTWILPYAFSAVIGEVIILVSGLYITLQIVPKFWKFKSNSSLFYAGVSTLYFSFLYFHLQNLGIIAGYFPADQVMQISFAINALLLSATLFIHLYFLLVKNRLSAFELQTLLSEQYIRMAFVAHEVRNPLAVAISWLDLLQKSPELFEKGKSKIHRNLMQINSLVSDLQDAQRVDSSVIDLEKEELELEPFLEECLQDYRTIAEEKGILLKTHFPDPNLKINADPLRMHQVINNLLSNSLKFTQRGGRLEVLLLVLEGDTLEIRISDNGRGMSQQFIKMATIRFSQENPQLERGIRPGLGLGLFLSRRIIEAHGGTLEVQSPGVGLGTVVRIHIPLLAELPSGAQEETTLQD